MINFLLFVVIGFGIGGFSHWQDTKEEVRWKEQGTSFWYKHTDYGHHHDHPQDCINGCTVDEGNAILIQMPDGSYRLCTRHGIRMFCTDVN